MFGFKPKDHLFKLGVWEKNRVVIMMVRKKDNWRKATKKKNINFIILFPTENISFKMVLKLSSIHLATHNSFRIFTKMVKKRKPKKVYNQNKDIKIANQLKVWRIDSKRPVIKCDDAPAMVYLGTSQT